MSIAKTLAKNTGFLFSSTIVDKVLSFFLVVVITRYLGDIGFGQYSFAFAFISLFTIFANLGLSVYMFREIPKDTSKTKTFFDNIFTLRIFILIGLFSIATVISLFWQKAYEIFFAILLVEVHEFISFFNTLVEFMFKAYEKSKYVLYSVIIDRCLSLMAGAFVLLSGYGLLGLILALIFAKVITAIYCYVISELKFIKIFFSFDFKFWGKLIKNSVPFWFTMIFQRVYYQTDKVMLTAMKDFAVTGWYSAASTLVGALTFIPTVIVHATFPAMTRFHHKGSKDLLKILYKKVFYYLFSVGLPLVIGINLLSQRIILFIYKEQFIQSGIALQILSWSLLFIFLNHGMGFLLNAIDKQAFFTLSSAVCAISNIALNLVLIPFFSYKGAAVATVITQTTSFIFLLYFTRKHGYSLNFLKIIYKPIVAAIGMGLIIHFIQFLPIIFIIPIAAVSYLIILLLIGGLEKEEKQLIKSFLGKWS